MTGGQPLGIVLKGYPRLSETFIAQEILNLERAGFTLTIFSLRQPTDRRRHPLHDDIQATVNYLPEYLYRQPYRVLKSWLAMRRRPGYRSARRQWLQDLRRDRSANRIRRFGQALVLAAERPAQINRLYAHFLHTPASVARYAGGILGIPWACSAHAKDIWTSPAWELEEKLASCRWLTTCTRCNLTYLRSLTRSPDRVHLNYHGIDRTRFGPNPTAYTDRTGERAGQPVRILSVGRLVAKKGYADLLRVLAVLPPDLHWEFHHIGGGPLGDALAAQSRAHGLDQRVFWHGAAPQQEVIRAYERADLFVLNCCIDQHGDRDGLPNVLVEAQFQGLPIIAPDISGIPELLRHKHNGLLVNVGDADALKAALLQLIQEPALRQRLGQNGKLVVEQAFDMATSFARLEALLKTDW